MITRTHRFHGYNSLRYVYRNGTTTRGPLFAIKSVRNDRRQEYRLAVVVSRKVHKSAVARNRIRRRLYEAVKSFEPEINQQPYDIVLTVFGAQVLDEPFDKLQSQTRHQLIDAGILVSSSR